MSNDEFGLLLASVAIGGSLWINWVLRIAQVGRRRGSGAPRGLLLMAPVVSSGLLLAALTTVSAQDVRDQPVYVVLYVLFGEAWVALALQALPLIGVSYRDDVLERGNRAAAVVVAAAVVALTLCFIGGNVGDGPGWWVVAFSAGLATAALLAIWLLLEMVAGISDAVTIDRDLATGVRVGAFLLACGLVFGRAAAGTWVSTAATIRDFGLIAAPAVVLLVAAAAIERVAQPRPERARPSLLLYGVVPALMYVNVAIYVLVQAGRPA